MSVHPRPIQTIQSGSTQACDSVCRLWPNNEVFPASAVIKSHSPKTLHPDWGEAILTQPVWHKENSLCICFKGTGYYSGQPRAVMEENVSSFLIIPLCGGNHLAMPILHGWKLLCPSQGWHSGEQRRKFMVHLSYTKLRKSVPGSGLQWR